MDSHDDSTSLWREPGNRNEVSGDTVTELQRNSPGHPDIDYEGNLGEEPAEATDDQLRASGERIEG